MTKQVKSASERSGEPLFGDDVMFRYPALKAGRIWSREHDLILLRAVLKYVLVLFEHFSFRQRHNQIASNMMLPSAGQRNHASHGFIDFIATWNLKCSNPLLMI